MSDKAAKAVMGWKPLGERFIVARFNSKYTNLTASTCFTPIEDEAQKDVFYDQLQQAIPEVPSHDVLCVVRDFKACVGNHNEGCEKIMGKNGSGNINGNGRRLCNLCVENNLAIGENLFPTQRNLQDDMDIPKQQNTHRLITSSLTASGRTRS